MHPVNDRFRVASLFAGVGGIDLGFSLTNTCQIVYANEFDSYAVKTYDLNFPHPADFRDIHAVKAEELPDMDILVGGFPCQAFSIAGLRQGCHDEKGRGSLFFELARILYAKKPRAAFFENVKNLLTHDNGRTIKIISETLKALGYHVDYRILNATEYGNIPQNRERIYIVAFRDTEDFDAFSWPKPIPLTRSVRDIIDFEHVMPEKYYYTKGKYSGLIYEELLEAMLDDDPQHPGIYQWRRWYVRKNQHGVVPTLTANQGGGGHNVCIVKTKYGIRKMTPRECFNAQGFPTSFRLPGESDSRLYKQAGNSVCVPVIARIAEQMTLAMQNAESHISCEENLVCQGAQ